MVHGAAAPRQLIDTWVGACVSQECRLHLLGIAVTSCIPQINLGVNGVSTWTSSDSTVSQRMGEAIRFNPGSSQDSLLYSSPTVFQC